MRRLLTAAVAVSAFAAAAAPAMAQTYGYNYTAGRGEALEARIDTGLSDGSLSFNDARRLRDRVQDVERTEARYRGDGMAGWQARALDRQYDDLSSEIATERHDGYNYERRPWDRP